MKDNLYIIKVTNFENKSLVKLGYSSNIEERLNCYFSHNPFIEIIGTYYREDACEYEKIFHKYNKSSFKYEWYDFEILDLIITSISKNIDDLVNNNITIRKQERHPNSAKHSKEWKQRNKDKISLQNKRYRERKKAMLLI